MTIYENNSIIEFSEEYDGDYLRISQYDDAEDDEPSDSILMTRKVALELAYTILHTLNYDE